MKQRVLGAIACVAILAGTLAFTATPASANGGCQNEIGNPNGGGWPGRWAGAPLTLSASVVQQGGSLTVTGAPVGSDVDICIGAFAGWPQFVELIRNGSPPSTMSHLGFADANGQVVGTVAADLPSGSYYVTATGAPGQPSYASPIVVGNPCTSSGTVTTAAHVFAPNGGGFVPLGSGGWLPGAPVSATFCSDPTPTNALLPNGSGTLVDVVPTGGLPSGDHSLILSGRDADGQPKTVIVGTTIGTPPTPSGATLDLSSVGALDPSGAGTVTVGASGLVAGHTFEIAECGPGVDGGALPATYADCAWENGVSGTVDGTGGAPAQSLPLAAFDCVAGDHVTVALGDGTDQTLLAWTPITFDCGHPPTAYPQTVSTAPNTAQSVTLFAYDQDGGTPTFSDISGPAHGTLSGTAPNLTYTPTTGFVGDDSFTFRASDGTYTTAPTTVTVHVGSVPGAPTMVVARSGAATASSGPLVVSFKPPTSTGGHPVTSYLLTCTSTNGGAYRFGTGTTSPVTLSGATTAKSYTCRVEAVNAIGSGLSSVASGAVVVGSPAPPTNVKAVSGATTASTGSLTVTYTLGANNGSSITSQTATCTSSNGGVTKSATHTGSTASPIVVTGVTTAKSYQCVVKATNARGAGLASAKSTAVIVGSPAAPTSVVTSNVQPTSLSVTYVLGASNGSAVTEKTATCTSTDGGVTRSATQPGSTSAAITVGGLTDTKTYRCTVKAKNARGYGLQSAPSAARIV